MSFEQAKTTTFMASEDFAYRVHVHEPSAPEGLVHLRITSQWGSARRPEELESVLNLTLTKAELQQLIAGLSAGL